MNDLDDFKAVLARLFIQGMCTQIPGLTTIMMSALRRPRTFMVAGVPKTFGNAGGVDPDIVTRCLRRMAAIAVLAEVVIKAEFPEYDILASLCIFNVSVARRWPAVSVDAQLVETCVRRLALTLSIDAQDTCFTVW